MATVHIGKSTKYPGYPACISHLPCAIILIFYRCNVFFFTLSNERHDFRKKKLLNLNACFGFFLLLPETFLGLTLQRGVTGTARMLHALTHSSMSRQVMEQM